MSTSVLDVVRRGRLGRRWRGAAVVIGVSLGIALIPAGTPAYAAVLGVEVVTGQSVADSASVKAAVATCPTGKRVIGGGWTLGYVTAGVHVPELRPTATSMEAVAYEVEGGYAGNWFVKVYAICALPPPGLELVTAVSPTGSNSFQGTTAFCPGSKKVLGYAAEVAGGGGQVALRWMYATALNNVQVAADEDATGTDNVWNVKAHAFCADPMPGLESVVVEIDTATYSSTSATATCPADTVVVGAGARATASPDRTLHTVQPWTYQGGQYVTARVIADVTYELTVTATCAPVGQLPGPGPIYTATPII